MKPEKNQLTTTAIKVISMPDIKIRKIIPRKMSNTNLILKYRDRNLCRIIMKNHRFCPSDPMSILITMIIGTKLTKIALIKINITIAIMLQLHISLSMTMKPIFINQLIKNTIKTMMR
jgi:hypothetical protein